MCDKIAISAYILKIVKNDPFLRLQIRAKEVFQLSQFFPLPGDLNRCAQRRMGQCYFQL